MAHFAALALGLLLSTAAAAVEIDPPLPPPVPTTPRAEAPSAAPSEPTALDRYQDCFQRMIDAGAADNAFMKKCLGIPDKPAPRKLPNGERTYLTKDDILAVAEKNLPALKECYDKLIAQSKDLGLTPEGDVEPHFTVQPDGAVGELSFDPSGIADVALLGCFRERIKAWAFPRSAGEAALVHLAFRLTARGKKTSVAVAKGFPRISGAGYGLSAEDILAVFRKNVPRVRGCYDELLKHKPTASGKLAVELLVSAAGKVSKVLYRELTVPDEGFKACVTTQLRGWKFPRPRNGEAATVRYPPLVFAPK